MEKSDSLISEIERRYSEAMRAQMPVMLEAEEARLFFRGDQWSVYRNGSWVNAPAPRWRVRMVANKLIPMASLLVGSLTRKDPAISVYPATEEERSYRAASCAEKLLRYYWDELKMSSEYQRWIYNTCILGNYFVETTWDHARNLPRLIGISPYSMAVEPGAVRFDDAAWIIVTEFCRIGELELQYNTQIDKVDPPSDSIVFMPRTIDPTAESKERTICQRMYERPTAKYPQGRCVIRAGSKIVHEGPLPQDSNGPTIRIVHFGAIELPDELWCTSPVSQCIPQQAEINRSRSQLMENRNLCSRPQLIAPIGSVEEDKWTNEPGAIVEWDTIQARGHEPHYIIPPSVPGWVLGLMETSEQDMYDIFGRHEVSQGQLAATSGRLAGLLKGSDDDRWYMMAYRAEECLRNIGRHLLAVTREYMPHQKVLSIVGKYGEMEFMTVSSSDFSDNVMIRYDLVSRIQWSKESMRQMALNLAQVGAIDIKTLNDLIEMPIPQKSFTRSYESRINARQENKLLADGIDFDPLPTDEHAVHIEEHSRYINSPEIRFDLVKNIAARKQLAAISGEQVNVYQDIEVFLTHIQKHQAMMPESEEPVRPKVNINLDRLIKEIIAVRPDLAEPLLQAVEQQVMSSIQKPPENVEENENKPAVGAPLTNNLPSGTITDDMLNAKAGEMIAEESTERYE